VQKTSISIDLDDVKRFSCELGVENDLHSRISILFWTKLYIFEKTRTIDIWPIIGEIKNLESAHGKSSAEWAKISLTKKPSKFKHKPLRGLWHKHYFSARSLTRNIINSLENENGIGSIRINRVFADHIGKDIDSTLAGLLAHEATIGVFEDKLRSRGLTGEWIVYSRSLEKNYYLTCTFHDSDHWNDLFEVREICAQEFPHLNV
jgi:hypothetical protein